MCAVFNVWLAPHCHSQKDFERVSMNEFVELTACAVKSISYKVAKHPWGFEIGCDHECVNDKHCVQSKTNQKSGLEVVLLMIIDALQLSSSSSPNLLKACNVVCYCRF